MYKQCQSPAKNGTKCLGAVYQCKNPKCPGYGGTPNCAKCGSSDRKMLT
jgi:hypothetical protein